MGRRAIECLITSLLLDLLCYGMPLQVTDDGWLTQNPRTRKPGGYQRLKLESKIPQHTITTPLATVPIVNTPVRPSLSIPFASPTGTALPTSSGQSWCIASRTSTQAALQVALDYACGYGGADCSMIQAGSNCYSPDSVQDHASFAFNSYYQKNPIPTSCDFGGNAVLTNVDPSTTSCQYPSMSTTSSLLNTSNQSGTRVFGSPPPNASVAAPGAVKLPVFAHVCIIMAVLTVIHL